MNDVKKEEVNFCEMPQEQLVKLLDFLGENIMVKEVKMRESFVDGKCVEKKWDWYSVLVVNPKSIVVSNFVAIEIMNEGKFLKMKSIFF